MSRRYTYFSIILLLVFNLKCQNIVDTAIIKSRVLEWSNAHNSRDLTTFKKLYASSLIYYGVDLSSEKALKSKKNAFKKTKFKSQSITTGIDLKVYDSGFIECTFTKKVFYEDETKEYPSYLLFKDYAGEYLICGESDRITDNFINYKLDIGTPIKLQTSSYKEKQSNLSLILVIVFIGISIIAFLMFYRKRKEKQVTVSKIPSELDKEIKQEINPRPFNLNDKEVKILKELVSKTKGNGFENFVTKNFDIEYFTLLRWTSDKGVDGVYPEDNKHPDLEYEFKHDGYSRRFAVECKWRSSLNVNGNSVDIAKKYQIDNYKKFQKEKNMDVYIALGLGGNSEQPNELFLIPLNKIYSTVISYNKLLTYKKMKMGRFFLDRKTGVLSW